MIPLHFPPDEDTTVHSFPIDIASASFDIERIFISNDFKLIGVVFVEESDRYAHDSVTLSAG